MREGQILAMASVFRFGSGLLERDSVHGAANGAS